MLEVLAVHRVAQLVRQLEEAPPHLRRVDAPREWGTEELEEVIMDVVMTNLYPRVYKRDTSKPRHQEEEDFFQR